MAPVFKFACWTIIEIRAYRVAEKLVERVSKSRFVSGHDLIRRGERKSIA
jgi:hypothetical protein